MFGLSNHSGKRWMAMILAFIMIFATVGDHAPVLYTVAAEEAASDSGGSGSEAEPGRPADEAGIVKTDPVPEVISPDETGASVSAAGNTAEESLPSEESGSASQTQISEAGGAVPEAQISEADGTASEAQSSEAGGSASEAQSSEAGGSAPEAQLSEESQAAAEIQAAEEGEPGEQAQLSEENGSAAETPAAEESEAAPEMQSAEAGRSDEEVQSAENDDDPGTAPVQSGSGAGTSDGGEQAGTETAMAPAVLSAVKASNDNEPQISILQNMVDEALASVTGTLSGRLQVILSRSTTYEGDVTISAGERTVADDFALELTAEDAGEDGMNGEGYTVIDGELSIRGIKVVMNSVMMAAGKAVNVLKGGTLEYNGTEKLPNTLEVTVGEDSSAEINTSDGSDKLTVTAQDGAKSVSINAGKGMNTVNGTVYSGDVSIVTGDDADNVNLDLEGSGLGTIYTDTAGGMDTLNVTDNGRTENPVSWEEEKDEEGHVISRKLSGGIYLKSGADDDTVNVDVRADAGDITVDTGLGVDMISVLKGDHRTPENIDYSEVYNPTEEINDNATSVVTVVNGDSDAVDRMTVDVDASDAIGGIALQGGQGVSVHLRGTLSDAESPVSGSAARLELTGEHGNKLFISTPQGLGAPAYNFTDALKNKRTVYVYADETGDYTFDGAADDFTDYVFRTPVNGLTSITVTGSDRPLLLSNVVLDSGETKDVVTEEDPGNAFISSDEYLKVNSLTAANLNVLLKGRAIEIGDVTAQNVRAESVQGISTLFEALSELGNAEFDMSDSFFENSGIDQMVADMISLYDSASIDVRGKVTAANDVALLARVKQYGDIFARIPTSLNFVNVKLASAGVHIAGTAGMTAQKGSVTAEAKIQTITGEKIIYDEDGVGTKETAGPPLSVTWVTDDASVIVDKDARVQAAEDILLNSNTDIKVTNNALTGGFLNSPLSMGLTWISNTVNTTVYGSLEAGHNVTLNASGVIRDETTARRREEDTGANGGFVAVNVVDQEVNSVIGDGAQVKAGGNVGVFINNVVDAQTIAASSGDKRTGKHAAANAFARMFKTILKPVMEEVKVYFKDDYYTKKVEKMLTKIAGGDYKVSVAELSAENAEKGSASVSVKMRKDDEGGEEGNDHLWALVDAKPKAGFQVGKVEYRYLEKGDDHYTYRTVQKDEKGRYVFPIDHDDIEVIVTYSEAQTNLTASKLQAEPDDEFEDVIDISQLFDDAADASDGSEDDDDFQMDDDVMVYNSHPLSIENPASGGKVVTWLTDDEGENIKTIYGSQKVRFVPNPDEGMELDTLTLIYNEEGPEGYDVTKKVTVAPDSYGRWYFTVPEALANDVPITVNATFKEAAGKKESPAHDQATGALAIGVVLNEGSAVIEPGAEVEAGGQVSLYGSKQSVMNNQADGTAVSEKSGEGSGEDAPQQTQLTKYSIPGVDYAVKADSTLTGTLSGSIERSEGASGSHPVITFKPDTADWSSVKVVISYYTKFNANPKKGTLWTSEVTLAKTDLQPDAEGAYTYQPDLGDYAVVNGTTMQISLVFLDQAGQIMTSPTQGEMQYLIRNPIRISNNALTRKDSEGKNQIIEIGKVNFVRTEGSRYYVRLVPEDGYKIDAFGKRIGNLYESNKDALYASWHDKDGTVRKVPLWHMVEDAADEWFFDVEDGNIALPEGELATIGAMFIEDLRDIVVPEDVQEAIKDIGTVDFSRTSAKAGDEVTVTLTGKKGWYGAAVTVSWSEINPYGVPEQKSQTFTPDANGKVTLTMPKMAENGSLKVTPGFSERIVSLNVTGSTGAPDTSDKSLTLSETSGLGYAGETVVVYPSAELAKQGYKVTEIKVQFSDDTQQIIPISNDTFVISEIAESSGSLNISATLSLREIEINPHTDETGLGSIEPEFRRIDKGDKAIVNIVPKEGYRIKKGTLKAEIITSTGTRQIVLDYEGPNRYSFLMPGGDEIDASTVVNLAGDFEPGSDGVSMSLGVAVSIGVLNSEDSIEIRGGKVTAGKGISVGSLSRDNKAFTEAKAGFSKGDTGLAGAIAVQVASAATTSAIRKDDNGFITVGDGSISVKTKDRQEFRVTGDASGKKGAEASGVGVGAGIAFAVDSVSNTAVIEDGVRLDQAGSGVPLSRIKDIVLSVDHKGKDTVTGIAGAVGGSAFVPVAAVDVYSSKAGARFGSLDLSARQASARAKNGAGLTAEEKLFLQNILPLAGKVKLNASSDSSGVQYNHDITADASARGGDTALGGAFIVSWIDGDVSALMNQGISAVNDVSIESISGEAMRATAKAAVSGGDKGKKTGKGGSADRQADSIMGGAGKVAGRYGGMDGAKLQNDVKGRQKAETAEGSVAGAGAFILNVQRAAARSEILDGVDVITQGKLSVKSANRTEASAIANASSVKSDVGVGVGVALNIVTMENIARIGNGRVEAAGLELSAVIAKEPTMARKMTVAENASNFDTQLNTRLQDAIKAIIGEDQFEKVEWLITPESEFFSKLVNRLVKDLNLSQLLDIASDSSMDSFANLGELMWERLKAFPESLAKPLWTVLEESYDTVASWSGDRFDRFVEDLYDSVATQLAGSAADILRKTVLNSVDSLLGSSIDMVTDKIEGKGWKGDKLKKQLEAAMLDALKEFTDSVIRDTVKRLSYEIPALTENNVEIIKKLKDTTFDELRKQFLPYVTKAFREQVYDYEPLLIRIEENGFTGFLEEELRSLLKEASVAATNEALDSLVGKLEVSFEREAISDRHVITTKAISGAGATTNTVAGSVAIAVANLTTSAVLAGGEDAVSVGRDMIVNAEELRRIRTYSTAAVDGRGEADNNEGAGNTEKHETGGGSAAQTTVSQGNITVTAGVGGQASFNESASEDNPIVWLDVEKGYELIEGETFARSYTDKSGTEIVDTVTVRKEGDDYFIAPFENIDIKDVRAEDLKELEIGIDIEFEKKISGIAKPQVVVKGEAPAPKDGAVTVSVEDGVVDGDQLMAGYGAEVKLTVDPTKAEGVRVNEISYTYETTEDGKTVTKTGTLSEGNIVRKTANANETVYVFSMPESKVSEIKVTFEPGKEERASETEAQDAAGRSVGVGAAFALTYGNSDVTAEIGVRSAGVTAGTLAVTASSQHEEENYATAGTDPFEGVDQGEGDKGKDLGMDASVAINILDNTIVSRIAEGTPVTTTEKGEDEDPTPNNGESDEDEVIDITPGALIVHASEKGANETKASAFSTGSSTAIGASVAVNVSLSDIQAGLGSGASAAGKAVVRSYSKSEDRTWSFASALGADVQRALNKVADGAKAAAETANSLTTGEYFDKKAQDEEDKKKSTDTSKRITERLNLLKAVNGDDASENLSVGVNLLRSQGAVVDNGDEANQAGQDIQDRVNEAGNQDIDAPENPNEKKKLQVAATVGVTVAVHNAAVTVGGVIEAGGKVELTARNAGNFNTRSTAAAMTTEEGPGKTIAAAVGISVNNNKATVDVKGGLRAAGDLTVASNLTENMSDDYPGRLAVQVLSGSVSGKGAEYSIAGAVGALVSNAVSSAKVDKAEYIEGKTVKVTAVDKSKLAVRAGGVNASRGANVGMGISVATIWSGDTVEAKIGDGTAVNADSFELAARKLAVTFDDYVFPLSWADLITDSSALNDEERQNVTTGLIDIHKKPGEVSYTVDVNMNTYGLMKIADMLNFLSATNYYTEAVAGSLIMGSAGQEPNKLNGAGSISIVRASNSVNAALGNNVSILKKDSRPKSAKIESVAETNARILGGAVSGGPAQTSAGVTLTFLYDKDEAKTDIGDALQLEAGSVELNSSADTAVQTFNAAAGVNTGDEGKLTLGGAVNVLLLRNSARNNIGAGAAVTSGGRLDVTAGADMDLKLVSLGVSGTRKGTAAGGTLAYIDDGAVSEVNVGSSHVFDAARDVNVAAVTKDRLISVLASASAALTEEGKSFAAAINVMNSSAKGIVRLGSGSSVKSSEGGVTFSGIAGSTAVNVTVAAAGSSGMAIGASVNANFYDREAGVHVGDETADYVIQAAKDVCVSAAGDDTTVMPALAAAGSMNGAAIGGNLPVLSSANTVETRLARTTVTAGGEAAFASHLRDRTYVIAGSIALSKGGAAVGATALLAFKNNKVTTEMGESAVTAGGYSGKLSDRLAGNPKFKGLYVGATDDNTVFVGAAGVALSTERGITGNLVTLSSTNTVLADASEASLTASGGESEEAGGDVTVEARNDNYLTMFAGGVNYGESLGVGASIAVLVSDNDVRAKAHDINAFANAVVNAGNDEHLIGLNINAGGSGKIAVELGASIQSIKSRVNAEVASAVTAKNGSFDLKAENTTDLTNVTVALAGAMDYAASPVFVATVFGGEANAKLGDGTVNVKKGVTISADSEKNIDQYTVGASAGGDAALSGAVSVVSIKDQTNALAASGVNITADTLDVTAASDYDLTGVSGAVSCGQAAGAVNGQVNIVKASTLAEMEGKAVLTGEANVKARSNRDIVNVEATVGAGDKSVGFTVLALIAGDRLDDDAVDMLTYGSAESKNGGKTFDAGATVQSLKDQGVDTSCLEEQKDDEGNVTQTSLEDDLTGNGERLSDKKVGNGEDFDAASGFISDDLYEGGDGENSKHEETEDIKQAKTVGSSVYTEDPKDTVNARIGSDAVISAYGVNVEAEQETLADMYGATVGAGATVGVGFSFSAAFLRSNVFATSLGDIDAHEKAVNISAVSRSGEVTPEEGSSEEQRMKSIKESLRGTLDPTKRSIRTIGLAVGGAGSAAVAIAAGTIRLDNITEALMGGTVKNAGDVGVKAESGYDNILAATFAVAGAGEFSGTGSIAAAAVHGKTQARMNETAYIAGKKPNVSVTTDSTMIANAVSTAAAFSGGGAVAGGLTVAINELTQNTWVDGGVQIESTGGGGALDVLGRSHTEANTFLLTMDGAAVGIGLSGAYANVKPTQDTTVGVNGDGRVKLSGMKTVDIRNDIRSKAESMLVSISGGIGALQGSAVLVFNATKAAAKAGKITGDIGTLNINGALQAEGASKIGILAGGGVAVGVSVNYVDIDSENNAEINMDDFNAKVKTLSVTTGDEKKTYTTSATAESLAGSAAAIKLGVNTGIAYNRARSNAIISGRNNLRADQVTLSAWSSGSADAKVTGISIAGVDVAGSVASAVNESESNATMKLGGSLSGTLDVASEVAGKTNAALETGSGSLVGIDVNVASAYGRTTSKIDVDLGKAPLQQVSITVANNGSDDVNTSIDNFSAGGVNVATMVGVAHSQDVYDTKVKLGNGVYDLKKIDIRTNYDTTTQSAVTPSAGGVKIDGAAIAVNRSTATNTVNAGTELALENASIQTKDKVNVYTRGSADVTGWINPATFQLDATVGVGSSQAKSDLSATQAVTLRLDHSTIDTTDDINVKNVVDKAASLATVSTSGVGKEGKDRVHLTPVSWDSNKAFATKKMGISASVLGSGAEDNSLNAGGFFVYSGVAQDSQTSSTARTDGSIDIGLVTVGNLDGEAASSDSYTAELQGFTANIAGDTRIQTLTDSKSEGVGYSPGSVALYTESDSNIKAGTGTENEKQTAKVVVGKGVSLTANLVELQSVNKGFAKASMERSSGGLLRVDNCSQPTHSWYDTSVMIGDGAQITSNGTLSVQSKTSSNADSSIETSGLGLIVNAGTMKGENNVDDFNRLLIGQGALLTSGGDMSLMTESTTEAHAISKYNADFGVYGDQDIHANNNINRKLHLEVNENASLISGGKLAIQNIVGNGDLIETRSKQEVFDVLEFSKAYGTTNSRIDSTLDIRGGVLIYAQDDIDITARNSGVAPDGSQGILSRGDVDATNGVSVDNSPEGHGETTINYNTAININRDIFGSPKSRTYITSENGQVTVRANNEGLHVETQSDVRGDSVIGGIEGKATNDINIDNVIWVDNTTFNGNKGTQLLSNFGEGYLAFFHDNVYVCLAAVTGYEDANSTIKGTVNAEIRSNDISQVEGGSNFTHIADKKSFNYGLDEDTDGWPLVDDRDFRNDWITKTARCDFCDSESSNKLNPDNRGQNNMLTSKRGKGSFSKVLVPLGDIRKKNAENGNVEKILVHGVEPVSANEIFVLDVETLLKKDVSLDAEAVLKYLLWKNAPSSFDVYLLPNAARLYAGPGPRLQYVADILRGDIRGDSELHEIDIITALTDEAFNNPVIPIGKAGQLDFRTGMFTLPENSDFVLYLHEISGGWLIDRLSRGMIRRLNADQTEINTFVLGGGDLPKGAVVESLTEDGTSDGWRKYWLGDTPGTAQDPDQTLVYLLVNIHTDEAAAFRTSVNQLNSGGEPIRVSLLLYRDSEADHMGEEKYNCMFFDTPEGEKSVVKIVTYVLDGKTEEDPDALLIGLRIFEIEGADLPAYSIHDHFYLICSGLDGEVNVFDDAYYATFDGNCFDSDYTYIEGIIDGDLKITIKKGQRIWPEWTGEDTAEDIQGSSYVCIDDVWYNTDEEKQIPA